MPLNKPEAGPGAERALPPAASAAEPPVSGECPPLGLRVRYIKRSSRIRIPGLGFRVEGLGLILEAWCTGQVEALGQIDP